MEIAEYCTPLNTILSKAFNSRQSGFISDNTGGYVESKRQILNELLKQV